MSTELEQVEIQIDAAQRMRELRDNCVKLMDSKYFKEVIDEGYFKEEAARLVMAKSSNLNADQMKLIDNMQYGIGALANFLESWSIIKLYSPISKSAVELKLGGLNIEKIIAIKVVNNVIEIIIFLEFNNLLIV